jgi:hypothetical protein
MSRRPGRESVRLFCEPLESRDAPAVVAWDQQSFDNLTSGAIPTNWQQWSSTAAVGFGASSAKVYLGAQALATTATSNQATRIWERDQMPADFAMSGQLFVDSLQSVQFVVRGSNLASATPTYYAVSVTRGMQVQLLKVINGQTTVLGQVQTSAYFSQNWVRVTVTPTGNTISAEIYRPDTNQYLNASGQWQSGAVNLFQITDASIAGPGLVGVSRPAQFAGTVYVDELQIQAPSPTEHFDTTPAGILPAGWSQWASVPAAAFVTSAAQSQSPPQSLVSNSTSSAAVARAWQTGQLPANVQVTASALLNTVIPLRLFARGSNLASATPTYYAVSITRGLEVSLLRVVNGVATQLATIKSAVYFSNQWVKVTLVANADRIQAIVYRPDTGQFLDAGGNWHTGIARALDVQDSQITGIGYIGVERPALYAGSVTLDDFDASSAGGDTTPPAINISAPTSGATLTGTATVSANVTDTGGVEHVEFYADGVLRFSTTAAPYQWSLDTSSLANGTHTLTVKAFDMAGNAGSTTITITTQNDTLPKPTIPQHYSHIRIAELDYSGTPFTAYEQNLLKNSVDLVIPSPSYLAQNNAVAPNTPQLIYTNVSNLYEGLLTDWLTYADAHGLDRELAFYHASQPMAWSGASASSLPVNQFWSVLRGADVTKLTSYTSASRNSAAGDLPFGNAGDSTYVGYDEKFREINFNLYMGASNGWKGVLEYATAVDASGNPTQWNTLTTLSDTTLGLAKSGQMTFDPPADWVTSTLGGSARLFYVRIRTTTSGNPPVATTILGRNYSNSNGAAVPSGTIPAFDFAADTNHDGYLSDAEFAHHAAGKDARFEYESRVFYPYYGEQRFVTNPSSPAVQQWAADYQYRFLQGNPLADGIFIDNSGGRSPLANVPLVESTASYSDDYGAMINAISRKITPKWVAANTSSGGPETDAVVRNGSMWIEEFAIRALAQNRQQFEDLAATVAHRQSLKSPAPYVVLDTLPTGGSPTDARTMLASLAAYYMLNDPQNMFLMLNGGFDPNSSWTQHWLPAVAYDVGQPQGAFSIFATGHDPANAKLTYNVYQRLYDNALVLYKPLSYAVGVGNGTLADNTATTHQLNGTYRVLNALGALGPPVTSVTLRNGEGVILVKA